MAKNKLPTGRIGRFARLAALGARAGKQRMAQALGGGDEAALASTASDALGQLRGLAAKVGQMASYVDGAVPEEHREHYERAMATLRNATPSMSAEQAAELVTQELGKPPEQAFAEWSPEPFASASIGQVHHATTHDGTAVAVKVQFANIQRAVEADLSNASLFGALLGQLGGKLGVKEQLAEVRARFLEELDYEHEARQQSTFRDVFASDQLVRIPEILAQLSTGRVLTSELAEGLSFEQACEAPEEQRRAWAHTLWLFVFWSLLGHGLFNADPHPGNYLFAPDGTVWFLDFGCTRRVTPEDLAHVRRCHQAAAHGNIEQLYINAEAMFALHNDNGPVRDMARAYVKACFAPIWTPGPFHITRPFAASLLTDMRDNAKEVLRKHPKAFKPLPAQWLFFNRLQLGFYSVLARLNVAVDYNALEKELLERVSQLDPRAP